MATVLVHQDVTAVADTAAQMAAETLQAAAQAHDQAVWVVAGGTAPLAAYQVLASTYRKQIAWDRVVVAIGDERLVPLDQPDANYAGIAAALLQPLRLSKERILWPDTSQSAEQGAASYGMQLAGLPQKQPGIPRFDHVWVGMGEDGHTLSLFPENPALQVTDALTVPVHNSPKPPSDRISLGLRALWGAETCLVIATGAGKAPVVARALAGDATLPIVKAITLIEHAGGQVTWLLDKAAAGQTNL